MTPSRPARLEAVRASSSPPLALAAPALLAAAAHVTLAGRPPTAAELDARLAEWRPPGRNVKPPAPSGRR
ncbi:MAG: hypothetical protein ACRDYV_00215 [Acidimicrobiia bacterium]